jgi:hypothetical protein
VPGVFRLSERFSGNTPWRSSNTPTTSTTFESSTVMTDHLLDRTNDIDGAHSAGNRHSGHLPRPRSTFLRSPIDWSGPLRVGVRER